MEPRQQRNWPPSAKETAIKTDDVFDDDAQIELGEPAVAMNEDDETERPMEPQDMGRVVRKFGQVRRLVVHVAAKSWADSIFMRSAAAAFWQMLSLAPLLLVLLGSLGYVGHWFGPDTVAVVESKIITFSRKLISPSVGDDLVAPTVADVLQPGHGGVLSIGFVLSLWAGSSAIAAFVDAITAAHGQASARHPVWQRIFALLLCIGFLIAAVLILPVVALGPSLAGRVLPVEWREPGLRLIDIFYYPGTGLLLIVALTTLYKLALQHTLRWRRLFGGALVAGVFFMAASEGLRRYLSWTAQAGISYGALATAIAFLLFNFFLGFAIILGAEFNAGVQEFWPSPETRWPHPLTWWRTRRELTPVRNLQTRLRRARGR
ncbi:YihY/virulence factor BrkB family protein [Streptomyces sp. NBC_00457]|uniref:YihY/virulence factor BrkB family protein n=1 Tax=Streptomyces sp. NBC_00457 TaxID=2975748 RepID=UPI002E1BD45D